MKIYKVEFNSYTNCINDVISHNTKDMAYIDTPKEGFLIKETDIEKFMEWGNGIKTMTFVGYLFDEFKN